MQKIMEGTSMAFLGSEFHILSSNRLVPDLKSCTCIVACYKEYLKLLDEVTLLVLRKLITHSLCVGTLKIS